MLDEANGRIRAIIEAMALAVAAAAATTYALQEHINDLYYCMRKHSRKTEKISKYAAFIFPHLNSILLVGIVSMNVCASPLKIGCRRRISKGGE